MKNQVLHSITVVRASLPSKRRLISILSLASAGGTMRGTSCSGTPFSRALAEDRLGLVDAAGGGQEARRLGDPQPDPEHERAGDRGAAEQVAPAEGRDEDPGQPGGDDGADAPEALEDHEPAAAVAGRQVLGEQAEVERDRAAEAEAGEDPERAQPEHVRRERRQEAEEGEDPDRDREAALAADAVGDRAPEPGAGEHADERRGDDDGALERAQPEVLGDLRQREGDEEDLGRVGSPGHPADAQQALLESAEADPVDGGLNRDGSHVGGHACSLPASSGYVVFPFPERRREKRLRDDRPKGDGYGRRSAAASAVSMVRAMSCTGPMLTATRCAPLTGAQRRVRRPVARSRASVVSSSPHNGGLEGRVGVTRTPSPTASRSSLPSASSSARAV